MSLKAKIEARLKAKAAGVNLSKERIAAIIARAEKGLTDESDDTQIDAQLDAINELAPFKEMASLDDHNRAKAKKDSDDKEKADKEAAEKAAKGEEVELPADTPEWMKAFMKQQAATNKALEEKLAAFGQKEVATTRREQFIKSMEGTPKEYQAKELKKFDLYAFRDDDHFNEVIESMKDDHAAAIQDDANAGLGGDRPAGGTGGSNASTKVASAEVVDAIMQNV